jgi:hypothetical protein
MNTDRNTDRTFYLCSLCFEVFDHDGEHHGHRLIFCDAGEPGDERRKPIINGNGRLQSTAPRWFLEAVGWLPHRPPPLSANG